MSQYYSRIHIKVSSPKVWKKFEDEDDAGLDLTELAETNHTSYAFDDEWSSEEDELTGIVEALAETLGPDGIIIADTYNINEPPYNYCIFYLGDGVRTDEFSTYSEIEKCDMHSATSITDIQGWLSYGEFYVSDKEKEQLFRCGIASAGLNDYRSTINNERYDKKVLAAFLENQSRLYEEPVAENEEEAKEFLEDVLAVVCKNLKEVRKYYMYIGDMDIPDMSDDELLEVAEVFAVGDGRFLVVEA